MPDLCDVVVVGAGVIGAVCAHTLAYEGYRVVLLDALDAGEAPSCRSWRASALPPGDDDHSNLTATGLEWLATAGRRTGGRVGPDAVGALYVWPGDGPIPWDAAGRGGPGPDGPAIALDRDEIHLLEPRLIVPDGGRGLFLPAKANVGGRRIVRWCTDDLAARSCEFRPRCRATGFSPNERVISTLETTGGRIATRAVVIAAGTGTADLAAGAAGGTAPAGLTVTTRASCGAELRVLSGPPLRQQVHICTEQLVMRPQPGDVLRIAWCGSGEGAAAYPESTPGDCVTRWLTGVGLGPNADAGAWELTEHAAPRSPIVRELAARAQCIAAVGGLDTLESTGIGALLARSVLHGALVPELARYSS